MTDSMLFRRRRRARAGLSLVEVLVSAMLLVLFSTAVLSAMTSATIAYSTERTFAAMQMDGRRALRAVAAELRMAGNIPNDAPGQPQYPYVFEDGKALGTFNHPNRHDPAAQHVPSGSGAFGECREICFLIPEDIDGDGLLTDGATGDIEWCDEDIAFVLITGDDGINRLQRWVDGAETDTLAMFVERVTFDTIRTDPTIAWDEVVITIYMARPARTGVWLQVQESTTVKMRNSDGVFEPAPSAI